MPDQNYSSFDATINAITTGTITSQQLAALQSIATTAAQAVLALQQMGGDPSVNPDIATFMNAFRTAALNTFGGNVVG